MLDRVRECNRVYESVRKRLETVRSIVNSIANSFVSSLVNTIVKSLVNSFVNSIVNSFLYSIANSKIPTPNPPYQPLGWSYRYIIYIKSFY